MALNSVFYITGIQFFQMPFTKEAVFPLVCVGCFIENYIAVDRKLDLFLGSLLSCWPLFLFAFCCCDKNAMTKHLGGGKGLFQLTFPDNSLEGKSGRKQAGTETENTEEGCLLPLSACSARFLEFRSIRQQWHRPQWILSTMTNQDDSSQPRVQASLTEAALQFTFPRPRWL